LYGHTETAGKKTRYLLRTMVALQRSL